MSRFFVSGQTGISNTTIAARGAAAAVAGLLGLFILFGVAFARLDAIHDAAHDTRHSVAFPCH